MNQIKVNDKITVEITDAGFEGKAVGRHNGLVVFVNNGVPGDKLIVKVIKVKKDYIEAIIENIIEPSPIRVEPRCKYFGVCGGCKWQNIDYKHQLKWKEKQVIDIFERIGGFANPPVQSIIGSDETFFYRGKMEFSFSRKQWIRKETTPIAEIKNSNKPNTLEKQGIFLGLHSPQRYDSVIDIDKCYLQSEISNKILRFTKNFARAKKLTVYDTKDHEGYLRFLVIREGKQTKEIMVNLVTYKHDHNIMREYSSEISKEIPEITSIVNTINPRKAQIAFGEKEIVYHGNDGFNERLGNYIFKISPSSFFQANVLQTEKLYQTVKRFAEFKKSDIVFDFYSGIGTISIYISNEVKEVIGIESLESAVADAKINAQINNATNCKFLCGDLKDKLTKDNDWLSSYPQPDVVIIDPPRSGMHPGVVKEILRILPERIVYISCNPATQARDIKLLCESKYKLIKLQPVDMFPHTYHIENVALLHIR